MQPTFEKKKSTSLVLFRFKYWGYSGKVTGGKKKKKKKKNLF